MCPKAKSDRVQTHRIELQQTERDAFEMLAASMAFKNVTEGLGSLAKPLLQMSVTSGVLFGSALTAWLIKMGADALIEETGGSGVGGLQTRIATDPAFISWVADFKTQMDVLLASKGI